MTSTADRAWLCLRIVPMEPRFHGTPEWPPSPARAFQALVSAAGKGQGLGAPSLEAFAWLEGLDAPLIGAPNSKLGDSANHYVPNNDIDAVNGIPQRVEKIRVSKAAHTRLLDEDVPYYYIWGLPAERHHLPVLAEAASHLNQFGRGMDMAYATLFLLPAEDLNHLEQTYRGQWFRPGAGPGSVGLDCPAPGSVERLETRFRASLERLQTVVEKRKRRQLFTQPPMVFFPQVRYGGKVHVEALDLVPAHGATGQLAMWPLADAHGLVSAVRDSMFEALKGALGERETTALERMLIGRDPSSDGRIPSHERLRIVPIPSIGHDHTSPQIRRLALLFPQSDSVSREDLRWAYGRSELGSDAQIRLACAVDRRMVDRYLSTAAIWHTITPAALQASRRRIDPNPESRKVKDGRERREEEGQAIKAVRNALRHAGVRTPAVQIEVRREPFGAKGARAETFAGASRFKKEQLWHVSVRFAEPVGGPLVIGDGRFLGLGVMCPAATVGTRLLAFQINDGLTSRSPNAALLVASALRRATLSRFQDAIGRRSLPRWVSGHGEDGGPAHDPHQLAYSCDLERNLLLIMSTAPKDSQSIDRDFTTLELALAGFRTLRAGPSGLLSVQRIQPASDDPLIRYSRSWKSVTPYHVNRHRRVGDTKEAVRLDLERACLEAGLPRPDVDVVSTYADGARGLAAFVCLSFEKALSGPLYLGRSRYKGGGLFAAQDAQDELSVHDGS